MDLLELFDEPTDKKPNIIIKSVMAWAGSKYHSIPKIMPHLPYYDGWIDVFGGSGVVTLNRGKSALEVYNDINSGVCDFYKCLRDPELYVKLEDLLNLFVHSREEWVDCHNNWSKHQDPIVRAAMWYYNLIYSFGKRGDAFGRCVYNKNSSAGLHIRKTKEFGVVHRRFQGVTIENLDFRKVFKDYNHPENVFYADPPYMQTSHKAYFGEGFNDKDHKDLLECVFDSPSFVAVSGHDTKLYRQYPWTKVIEWEAYRSIARPDNLDNEDMDPELKNTRDVQYRTECLYIKER